ncbi:unnamed protein product, partial [Amoebophrya sp. A25]
GSSWQHCSARSSAGRDKRFRIRTGRTEAFLWRRTAVGFALPAGKCKGLDDGDEVFSYAINIVHDPRDST